MISVEVCLSPDLIGQYELEGKTAVVVDVLRATSCMTAGIASGIPEIMPFQDVDKCLAMKTEGYLIAGERGGEKLPGFDLGNSPFEYMADENKGRKVAVTTTNGTHAIKISEKAEEIVIGSFLNLTAVVDYVQSSGRDCIVVCAGWRGKVNLEDSLFAGALIAEMSWQGQPADDAAQLCKTSFLMAKEQLQDLIGKSEHALRLKKFNVTEDIKFCATLDKFDCVPVYKEGVIRNFSEF